LWGAHDRQRPASFEGRSVLLVEDHRNSRRFLHRQLEGWGFDCTALASPEAAVAMLAGGRRFDVAVLDLYMPGMDGTLLAETLRRLPGGQDLPMVLLAAPQWRPTDDQRALFSAIISKPPRGSLLQDRLHAALTAGAPGASPQEQVGSAPTPASRASLPPVAPALRILLAEDNPVNQKVAQLMLAKLGHRVDTVGNGREAVEATSRVNYDIVLMDVQMPEVDGLAATRMIRSQPAPRHQPRIAAMTAGVTSEDRDACTAAGMDAYLSKPVRPFELRRVIDELLATSA
jgi:CheY-like chemotaxis protein